MKRFLIYLPLNASKASCLGEVMIILGVVSVIFLTCLVLEEVFLKLVPL